MSMRKDSTGCPGLRTFTDSCAWPPGSACSRVMSIVRTGSSMTRTVWTRLPSARAIGPNRQAPGDQTDPSVRRSVTREVEAGSRDRLPITRDRTTAGLDPVHTESSRSGTAPPSKRPTGQAT